MRETEFSGHSNVDTDIADNDGHYLESLFVGRMKSGIIYLGPDEMASQHKIRVNLTIGTKNTRIGVPRELEVWMQTTLYRDDTILRWILFEDRVVPRHQRQLPDGVDRCVCMLQPARTTVDGVSYMASCRIAMSRGQRRVFESHARQMEQDDRFVSGVFTTNLLHSDVEPNASSDILIVQAVDERYRYESQSTARVICTTITDIRQHPLYRSCFAGDLLPHESHTPHFDDCLPRCLEGFVSC